jgi:hypothetical protein
LLGAPLSIADSVRVRDAPTHNPIARARRAASSDSLGPAIGSPADGWAFPGKDTRFVLAEGAAAF